MRQFYKPRVLPNTQHITLLHIRLVSYRGTALNGSHMVHLLLAGVLMSPVYTTSPRHWSATM